MVLELTSILWTAEKVQIRIAANFMRAKLIDTNPQSYLVTFSVAYLLISSRNINIVTNRKYFKNSFL